MKAERIEHLRVADLTPHPEAGIVPQMRSDEWASLLADVSRQKVQVPLLIQSGKLILDGRHRHKAAVLTDAETVPCIVVDLSEADQLKAIINAAVLRRQLSDDQRSVLAARLLPAVSKAAVAEKMEHARAAKAGNPSMVANGASKERSRTAVAKQLNVSEKKVRIAAALQKAAPEVAERVLAGETKLAAAARESLKGMKTPKEAAKADPARRFSESLHKLYVLMNSTRNLGGIKKLASKWEPKDRAGYAKELRRISAELDKWIVILEKE